MRRVLVPMFLLLIACRAIFPVPTATPSLLPDTPSPVFAPSPTPLPAATHTPEAPPEPTIPATTPPSTAPDSTFAVRLHPDGPLYIGDLVSLEVIPPPGEDHNDHSVLVRCSASQEPDPLEAHFRPYGIGERSQATLQWAWDTSTLAAGEHTLTFSVQPDGPSWTETISLNPRNQVPPPEPGATWVAAESNCCLVYYITGTPAERDLSELLTMADRQADKASLLMGIDLDDLGEPISVTFLPRVLGHGGFASQEISVSYLDRNYAGRGTETVLHHEIIHILDGHLGGDLRPTMFIEGLAVYLTGGHYKPEPLMPRAAALMPPEPGCVQDFSPAQGQGCGLGWYIPLDELINNFYFEQHEIGYLEAAGLVEFMVETWGWDAFSNFYRGIHPVPKHPADEQVDISAQYRPIDNALLSHFGITLEGLEARFLDALREEELTPELIADTRLTVELYEAIRRYQQLLDPSAYFLNAWLPNNQQMRQQGIVADYLRRPSSPENLSLEVMLVSVDADLRDGDYPNAEQTLSAVIAVLDEYKNDGAQPFAAHPLAADYLALVRAVQAVGYQPKKVQIQGERARVWASTSGPALYELKLIYSGGRWTFDQEVGVRLDNWFSARLVNVPVD